MENNTENVGDGGFHLKKVEHDPIEDLSADQLMANVRKSIMTRSLIISLILHVIFVGVLSIGFIKLCIDYKSIEPRKIIAEEKAKKEEEEKKKKRAAAKQAAIEKAKQEAKTEASAKSKPKNDKPLTKIEKAVTETSDERPAKSSLDSLDDDF